MRNAELHGQAVQDYMLFMHLAVSPASISYQDVILLEVRSELLRPSCFLLVRMREQQGRLGLALEALHETLTRAP